CPGPGQSPDQLRDGQHRQDDRLGPASGGGHRQARAGPGPGDSAAVLAGDGPLAQGQPGAEPLRARRPDEPLQVRCQPSPAPPGLGLLVQSPDGSRLFAGDRVVTPAGALVGNVSPSAKIGWRWADDSRHLCAAYDPNLAPNPSAPAPASLFVTLPGSAPAAVAQAGRQSAQAGVSVLGCSFTHGTATVGQ